MIIDECPGDVEVCGDDLTLCVGRPSEGSAFNVQLLMLEGWDVEPATEQLETELIRERADPATAPAVLGLVPTAVNTVAAHSEAYSAARDGSVLAITRGMRIGSDFVSFDA